MQCRQAPSLHTAPGDAEPCGPEPCGLLRRLLVMLYDALAILALLMIATALVLLLPFGNFTAGKDLVYSLYLLSVWFIYLAWCWRNGGMTLGMRAWEVVLRADDSQPVPWKMCFVRFAVSLLSALPLGAGFIWCVFAHRKRTWHDRLSHSSLVRNPRPARR
jgi:uncharacterized RDD family membrane protein YckC